ncbi:hypothetical protein DFH07DRAFT_838535 [Mycena maculata]|uniref:C2H2-type domain-containing protein n=1 Tax=Mycena maculata TaxID=230809 RepID=A0AAD7IFP0_9AGAR|nr:hypothetical protein DFH07DRAFT_838535 [Mycena maculata]
MTPNACEGTGAQDLERSWMGHTPPRRVTMREQRKCEGTTQEVIPSSSKQILVRTSTQHSPQLVAASGGMHVLVPSDDAGYDVFAEDAYDGLPPICCLEDLDAEGGADESEEVQVQSPTPDLLSGADRDVHMHYQNEGLLRVKPSLEEPERIAVYRDSKECKREPSEEASIYSASAWSPTPRGTSDSGGGEPIARPRNTRVPRLPERDVCPETGHCICKEYGCGKTFTRLADCQRHESTHLQGKPFACPGHGCGKSYGRKDALLRHLTSVHETDNEILRRIVDERAPGRLDR